MSVEVAADQLKVVSEGGDGGMIDEVVVMKKRKSKQWDFSLLNEKPSTSRSNQAGGQAGGHRRQWGGGMVNEVI